MNLLTNRREEKLNWYTRTDNTTIKKKKISKLYTKEQGKISINQNKNNNWKTKYWFKNQLIKSCKQNNWFQFKHFM